MARMLERPAFDYLIKPLRYKAKIFIPQHAQKLSSSTGLAEVTTVLHQHLSVWMAGFIFPQRLAV